MKKINIFCAVIFCVLAAIFMTACSDNPSSLSAKKVVKLKNAQNELCAVNMVYAEVRVGYYEANDKERYQLRQLVANGLVEYSCDVIRDEYQNPHYFVNVALTKDGEKIAVEALPESKYNMDMVQPDMDSVVFVEDTIPVVDVQELTAEEKALYIRAEKLRKQQEATEKAAKEKQEAIDKAERDALRALNKNQIQGTDKAYPAAKAREEYKSMYMEAYSLKAVIAKNIVLYKEEGTHKAKCVVISEIKNVTPVGRIMLEAVEGTRVPEEVFLTFYQNSGWTLTMAAESSVEKESVDKIIKLFGGAADADANANTNTNETYSENNDDDSSDYEGFYEDTSDGDDDYYETAW